MPTYYFPGGRIQIDLLCIELILFNLFKGVAQLFDSEEQEKNHEERKQRFEF
jgi:hypothetical protein